MSLLKSFSKRKLLAEKALPVERSKSSSSLKEERLKEPSSSSSSSARRPPLKRSSSVGKEMKVACLKREVKLLDHPAEPSSGDFADDGLDPTVNGKVRGEFELSLQASGDEAQHLEQFFAGVDALKEALRRVKATNRRLRDLHEQAFDVESPPTSATEAHELREAFARLAAKNEAQFEDVRERTLDLKDVPLESDSFRRLKHNILNGTNMKSAQLLLDFKSVLKDHNQRLKEETWRQLKEQRLDAQGNALPGGQDEDDDDDDFHDARAFDPNTEQVGDFMQKFVFREKASSAKKYLEEKQRDLEVIEKNMMELNELMKDFAVMVESANEPLDQIDTYLRGTKANMVMVEENLRQAKYKVMGMRKKKLFTALGVAVVVIVVVAVVVGLVCLL